MRFRNKLEVVIIANETLFPKPPGIELFVIPSNIVNYSIDGFCYKNYSKTCRSPTKYEHFCEFLLNEPSGEYKIFTKIDDPRCNIKTLWTNISTICVTWTNCKVKVCNIDTSTVTAKLNCRNRMICSKKITIDNSFLKSKISL